jgi:hypothetical protein
MRINISFGKRRNKSVAAAFVGGLICGAMAVFGFNIALNSSSIEGGLPFLPQDLNQTLGRIAFGTGAVFLTLITLYAFWEAYTLYRERQ